VMLPEVSCYQEPGRGLEQLFPVSSDGAGIAGTSALSFCLPQFETVELCWLSPSVYITLLWHPLQTNTGVYLSIYLHLPQFLFVVLGLKHRASCSTT
jgi:hypothetical protein